MNHVQATLAELRARRAQLDQAITALEDLMGTPESARTPSPAAAPVAARRTDPRGRRGLLSARVAEVKKLFDSGASLKAIGGAIGVSEQAVQQFVKLQGWKRQPAKPQRVVPIRRVARGVSGQDGEEE